MQNYVQRGETLTLTAPYTVTSGSGALVGSIFGVASADYLSGAPGEFRVVGVLDLTKAAGVTIAAGSLVYWDDSAKAVTTTSGGNTLIGVSTVIAASADATVRVRLNGSFTQ